MYKKGIDTPIQFVKGVGPKLAVLLGRKEIQTVGDAFYFLPRTYEDRSQLRKISELQPMEYALFNGVILDTDVFRLKGGRRKIFTVKVGDSTGHINCKWFNFNERFMHNIIKPGAKVFVSGETSLYGGRLEVHHPDIEVVDDKESADDKIHYGRIVPIYSETEGLKQKMIRRIMFNMVDVFSTEVEDYMPKDILERMKLPALKESLKEVHFPSKGTDISQLREFATGWQKRLIFDEFFVLELALALRRRGIKKKQGIKFSVQKEWLELLNSMIPFQLTGAQKKVIQEILHDMNIDEPMNRLIQGDVGSGKTVVAFYAAVICIMNGYQAAIMAPTEILAEQHFKTFQKVFGNDFKAELLVGSMTKAKKQKVKQELQTGEISFLIGTHAVIQDDVDFKKLGLIIVDEQHRFGVEQRLHLANKGNPDVLVMTATPIPRTLSMTLYGDLDVSVIDEKPAGRIPIITKLVYDQKRNLVYDFVRDELKKGLQAYFVYPLVEESDKLMLKNAKDAAKHLAEIFNGYTVGLLHGRMRAEEKEQIMREFKEGKINLLVSTTVIEVGIDVPNATVMFIEHPERFGLSQLHQLRGRIGRGESRSVCILMAENHLNEVAVRRLTTLVKTDDGFKVAEEDLAIRGPGEFMGTKQHGIPGLRVADLVRDMEILILARTEALRLVQNDPDFMLAPHKQLKNILVTRFQDKIRFMNVG
jgi:ATP-dependent DNA helicase RecG